MIMITGDTHGEKARFCDKFLPNESEWSKNDVLIIAGDAGLLYRNDADEQEFLDELEAKPYTIAFVDGNHENFPAIFSYPQEEWMGGKIHRIRRNVIHLMRGQVFTIEGKTFFTFGGAYSIDRYCRKEGVSYWEEEIPSPQEYREASENLKRAGGKVDYIVTHTAPQTVIRMLGKYPDKHDIELTGFLDWVMYETKFTTWYFGHWHEDKEITPKFRLLWFDCERIL